MCYVKNCNRTHIFSNYLYEYRSRCWQLISSKHLFMNILDQIIVKILILEHVYLTDICWRNSADFLHFPVFSLTLSLALEFLSSNMTGNTLFSMIPTKSGYFPKDWKKQPILYLWSRATSSTERAVSRRGTRSLSTPSSHSPLRLSSFTTWQNYLTCLMVT